MTTMINISQSAQTSLRSISNRHAELENMMAKPEIISNYQQMRRLGREYARLSNIVKLKNQLESATQEMQDAETIIAEESDPEMLDMAREIVAEQKTCTDQLVEKIQIALIPPDETDDADAVVEIRAGTGGDEAGLFAAELFRMYQRYAEIHNWRTSVLSTNETGIGGIKEIVFELEGEGAYRRLKLESGVHRVQRVPLTESQGRIHTSAATVAVLPKADEVDVEIDERDLKIDIFHAGGHGGQNVNKVATAVRITHEPSGIVAQCQNERSQLQNRLQAMAILRSRLWDMEIRKRNAEEAAARKAQVGSGDRSEKIRTYNFPQSRVTDHRINFTSHNLPKVLDGQLDEVVDVLLQTEQSRKLNAMASS